jgi:uncharacterized cupin superfamily protein
VTMNLTRASEAPSYTAPLHHDVSTVRLQGHEAGDTDGFWVGVSVYQPGGMAETAATKEEMVYVVLEGELVITAEQTETVLRRLDSVHFCKGEVRSIQNRSDQEALLLVTCAHPDGEN